MDSSSSRRAPTSSEDAVSSKMQKTNVTPPQRLRRQTLRDDLKVQYVGSEVSKVGSLGRQTNLSGNMYSISYNQNNKIYQYSVVFEPEIKFSGLKSYLVSKCDLGQYHYNFNVCYLPHNTQQEFTKTVQKRDGTNVTITFKFKNQLNPNSVELNSMIGSFVKRCVAEMGMVQINKGLFLMDSKQPIADFGMDIVAGYNTTVLPHENELLLTVNMVNKVMNGKNANDYMKTILRDSQGNKNALMEELIGKTVLTVYNNKTYKIDDIDFELNPMSTFEKRQPDGTKKAISYADYFMDAYKVKVTDLKQPLFISRPKKVDRRRDAEQPSVISLIPEFCTVCGIPEKLFQNFQFKKAMDNTIKKDPATRNRLVQTFMKAFRNSSVHKEFAAWGFNLNDQHVPIPARVLNTFNVEFGKGQKKDTSRPFDMRGVEMYEPGPDIKRFVLIAPDRCREAKEFLDKLQQVARPLGMNIANPKEFTYRSTADVTDCLNRIKGMNGKAHMICVILRNQDKTLYDHVKKQCCLEMGVPSQCLLMKHFRNPKGLLSVITKIALQMGVKMGGAGWSIKFPPPQTYMIVGMDTYHDSAKKGYSCVATVASLNNTFSKFTWATAMVPHKQEVNTLLKSQFTDLVREFIRVNRDPPSKIIIFRDGVGEGQVKSIMEFEFTQMQSAIEEHSPGAQVAFFTISKRIETRFYDGPRNPMAGTVIDQVATHNGQKDFYLIPLESRQGTVTPIHYRMHFNTLNLKADNFQYCAYMTSFLYFNWNGAIKVPCVCQYAHKLAFLVGTSIHDNPHRDLASQLFFL